MKLKRWTIVGLGMPLLLTACKGFWDAPATSRGTGTTTSSSGSFYVMNVETSQIAGYSVNTGTLTALSGSPYTLPATPLAIRAPGVRRCRRCSTR